MASAGRTAGINRPASVSSCIGVVLAEAGLRIGVCGLLTGVDDFEWFLEDDLRWDRSLLTEELLWREEEEEGVLEDELLL